jgi:hypothetical protein
VRNESAESEANMQTEYQSGRDVWIELLAGIAEAL